MIPASTATQSDAAEAANVVEEGILAKKRTTKSSTHKNPQVVPDGGIASQHMPDRRVRIRPILHRTSPPRSLNFRRFPPFVSTSGPSADGL